MECSLGNISKKLKPEMEEIASLLGVTLTFYDDAKDLSGNRVEDAYRMECSPEDIKKFPNLMELFIDASLRISKTYKRILREAGYPVDALPPEKIIYLGCENEYWRDLL